MIVFTTVVFFLAGTDATITSYPTGRLFGSKISIDEAPYQATIHCQGLPTCSGAIISANHLLTAAHCVVNYADCKVRVGSSLRNSEGNLRSVKLITVHEAYDQETYPWKTKRDVPANDLAILKLGNWLPLADKVHRSIELFNETEVVDAGVDAIITGWSKLNDSSKEEHLTSRTIQTLDASLCDKAYQSIGGVPAGQICASYPGAVGRGGCQGDSGAPLVVGGRLAGILSWGNGCVKNHYPGLYTEVAFYRDWIDRNIQS